MTFFHGHKTRSMSWNLLSVLASMLWASASQVLRSCTIDNESSRMAHVRGDGETLRGAHIIQTFVRGKGNLSFSIRCGSPVCQASAIQRMFGLWPCCESRCDPNQNQLGDGQGSPMGFLDMGRSSECAEPFADEKEYVSVRSHSLVKLRSLFQHVVIL